MLLSQSHHCNARIRLGALASLRKVLTTDDHLLHQCLADVLSCACELFVDRDSDVRDAVVCLLRAVVLRVSVNQITPFFPLIMAHLSCAMTHIDDDVRAASLSLLDVCLDQYAALVVGTGSAHLLPDFVSLVSHRRQSGSTSSGDMMQRRSLTVNPASRLSEQKWRTKVTGGGGGGGGLVVLLMVVILASELQLQFRWNAT